MADDNSVMIRFGASTEEALSGIGQIRDALLALTAPVNGIGTSLDRLGETFGAALPRDKIAQCAEGLGDVGAAARRAAIETKAIGDQIKALHQGAAGQRILLNAEASEFQITQDRKFALLQEETRKEYEAELALLDRKLNLDGQTLKSRQAVSDQILLLEQKHRTDMLRLDAQSIAAQQALWTGYLSTVTGAFNTQLRGLLEGTTSWHKAMIKMLEDLTIKFIETAEQMVVKWLAAELARTTATTTGAAARAAAEQSAQSTGILAAIGNALRSIFSSAGQTSAEVSAAVAPEAGPAAPAIGAAAGASVVATATGLIGKFDIGGYVVRSGLGIIHAGETITPAQVDTPFRPMRGAAGSGDVHFHVAAMDSRSVERFFTDNSRHVMKAVQKALKSGQHLRMAGA